MVKHCSPHCVPCVDAGKDVCEGANFMDGYQIVDELDVKTLPPGKAYRFWFRAGSSQAGVRCDGLAWRLVLLF